MNHSTMLLKNIITGIVLFFPSFVLCKQDTTQNARMTIFVHGTVKPAEFSFSSLIKIMRDSVDNSLYSRAAYHIRNNPISFQGQAMQGLGLQKIDLSPEAPHNTARTIAFMYDLQHKELGTNFTQELYYTFGWNGLLSISKRFEEAQNFYKELKKELQRLQQKGINPEINIIAYSHGGNVTLYLPSVREQYEEYQNDTFMIDQLVTIGTPIQRETDHLVAKDMFKKVYHLYSTEDSVQVWDFFSSQKFFSKRCFSHRSDFTVPEKLRQIRLRVTKKIKWRHKAKDIKAPHEILNHHGVRLVHKDPGHTELWNFKWGAYWYRDTFPMKPLPVMSIIPTIITTVDQHPKYKNITFDYAPTEEGILLRHKPSMFKKALPFLNHETHTTLHHLAYTYEPSDFTLESQQDAIALALEKARNDLLRIRRYRKPRSKTLAKYMNKLDLGGFDFIPEIKQIRKTHLLCTQQQEPLWKIGNRKMRLSNIIA